MTTLSRLTLSSLPELASGSLRAALNTVQVWNARARQRRALVHLDDHMLRDIGLDRPTAAGESGRPFWQE